MSIRCNFRLAKTLGIVEFNLLAVFIEPIAFLRSLLIEDRAEDPAMSVEIGELRGF